MKVTALAIPDLLVLEPRVFGDERGFFYESYNKRDFVKATGITAEFVQDNHSRSARNVLRGLHYQVKQPQGKLVRVTFGEVYDVAVDIRRGSPTLGMWQALNLSAENKRVLWIPEGFAHGFLVLSDVAEFVYKASGYYAPEFERTIRWDDGELGIEWPLSGSPLVSPKDEQGKAFREAELF